jgi:ribosomal protein S18 acetylase RimI-like enzyme
LADLEPGYFEKTRWYAAAPGAPAVVLVYSGFAIPVVLSVGGFPDLVSIFEELWPSLQRVQEIYFSSRREVLPLIERSCIVKDLRPMLRMVLTRKNFQPALTERTSRLGPDDLAALTVLYQDGESCGEAPDFFLPGMLTSGVYYGVHEGKKLVAVAGTHVFAPGEGVAGLGNIYTRRDCRGRGCGAAATSAVARELLAEQLPTIILNVRETNLPAIRLYQRLGFRPYCKYYEIIASPKAAPSSPLD